MTVRVAGFGGEARVRGVTKNSPGGPFFSLRRGEGIPPSPLVQPISTQLAEKINAKQKSISCYETNASLSSIRTLVKMAKFSRNQLVIFWMSKAKKPKEVLRQNKKFA